MQGDLRRDLPAKGDDAEILHDKGVDARAGGCGDVFRGGRHFAVRDQRVERQMDGDPAHVAVAHHLRQLVQCEISCAAARIEAVNAEIDRVCAVTDGGVQGVGRACGRK